MHIYACVYTIVTASRNTFVLSVTMVDSKCLEFVHYGIASCSAACSAIQECRLLSQRQSLIPFIYFGHYAHCPGFQWVIDGNMALILKFGLLLSCDYFVWSVFQYTFRQQHTEEP